MQTKLNQFLGLSDSDEDLGDEDLADDLPQQGAHYWTDVKTGDKLAHPGACTHELEAAILTLQYSAAYSGVSTETR